MSDLRTRPNPLVHQVIDLLAHRDLETAGKVTDPDAWLREARRRRWVRHENQLTVSGIADLLDGRSRSESVESLRRDYDTVWPECATCDRLGRVPLMQDGVERWARCPDCHPRSNELANNHEGANP